MAIKGASIVYVAGGSLLVLSGIKGATIPDTLRALLSGNLTLQNTEPIQFGSSGGASGATVSGSAIVSDAMKYVGHKYVFGGPSNETDGWDCSSFVSYVLGHDLNTGIPGGTWASETNSGKTHGPVTGDYLSWTGATTVPASQVRPGDMLCWSTHVGFAVNSTQMISALDTQDGTKVSGWAGPTGEGSPTVRRITATVSGPSVSVVAGSGSQNYIIIANYLVANGYSHAAAAGICGCIAGESAGSPESKGDGGFGLIGWTPQTPGQYADLTPTGNASADLSKQLPGIIQYNNAQGAGLVQMLNSITDPVQAADFYSQNFERPKVKDSDVLASVAKSVFAEIQPSNAPTG